MNWYAWALLLIIQNASFTWVSRARNSGSVGYHALACAFSNGVWFANQLVLVDSVLGLIRTGSWTDAVMVGAFYTVCTLVGSVGMHWLSIHYLERGKRKVGA